MAEEVGWSRRSLADLERITAYIRIENPYAADRIFERLHSAGESLADHPRQGRSMGGNLREFVIVQPYLIGYRVIGDRVVIAYIRHSARRPLR